MGSNCPPGNRPGPVVPHHHAYHQPPVTYHATTAMHHYQQHQSKGHHSSTPCHGGHNAITLSTVWHMVPTSSKCRAAAHPSGGFHPGKSRDCNLLSCNAQQLVLASVLNLLVHPLMHHQCHNRVHSNIRHNKRLSQQAVAVLVISITNHHSLQQHGRCRGSA